MTAFLKKALLPVIVAAAGIGAGMWFLANPGEVEKRPRPEAQALLVETGQAARGEFHAVVEAMGQVRPAAEISLRAQVGGEILSAAPEFVPGGFFARGEAMLEIDPQDYALAVQKQEAILKQAQADYSLEQGRQSVAVDELKILQRTTGKKPGSTDLVLRKPQLEQAKAELEKARADLAMAKLAFTRATVAAPFNALVTQRAATAGDKVAAGGALATLAGTDEYWVEISLPVDDLRWLDIPRAPGEQGSAAAIILDGGRGERQGRLYKTTGTLDAGSRLATLLVAVEDPLLRAPGAGEGLSPLILSDYVKVVLRGRDLGDVLRVPLSWVRDDSIIWVRENGVLAFRPVEIVYEDREYAYISSGISAGDKIVASDISVPVEGMKIRTLDAPAGLNTREAAP